MKNYDVIHFFIKSNKAELQQKKTSKTNTEQAEQTKQI